MTKAISLSLILMTCVTVNARTPITDCPNYVREAGKCEPFLRVLTAAGEYAVILKSEYKITKAYFKDKYVFVTVTRGNLSGEIKVGQFEGIKKVSLLQSGEIDIEYTNVLVKEITWKDRATYIGGGFVGGLLTGLFFLFKIIPFL